MPRLRQRCAHIMFARPRSAAKYLCDLVFECVRPRAIACMWTHMQVWYARAPRNATSSIDFTHRNNHYQYRCTVPFIKVNMEIIYAEKWFAPPGSCCCTNIANWICLVFRLFVFILPSGSGIFNHYHANIFFFRSSMGILIESNRIITKWNITQRKQL